MPKQYDAVIIGSGIMGCSIAFELAKKGWKTLNVDKLAASGAGSTVNSCAIIRVYYSTLEGTAVAYEAYHYWDQWKGYLGIEDARGMAKFLKQGALVFKTKGNDELRKIIVLLKELNIPFEEWSMEKICERYPIYDDNSYWPARRLEDPDFNQASGQKLTGAVWFPTSGFISDPQLSTHNVQVAAESHGAEFLFNVEVVDIRKENGRSTGVALKDGTIFSAPVVVNAAGPHSFIVNRMAGIENRMKIKTRALRQEVIHIPAPPEFDFEKLGCVTSDNDIGCYSRPELGNHILCGSEDPPCDPHVVVDDPDNFNRNLTEQAKLQAMRLALRIPNLGIPGELKGVVDLYDVTDDWIPIYDKSDLPGFYLCIGTSGNQYKNAPVTGKLMAKLIEECEKGRDHDADPVQFHLDYIDRTFGLDFYSRNREINRESSFSVLG